MRPAHRALARFIELNYLFQLGVQLLQRFMIPTPLLERADNHLNPRRPLGAPERVKHVKALLNMVPDVRNNEMKQPKCQTLIPTNCIAYPKLVARTFGLSSDPGLEG